MRLDGFCDISDILRSGIYILVHRGVIVYVGQSKSLYQRIYTHRNLWNKSRRGKAEPANWLPTNVKGMLFDEVHIQPCALERLNALEREMIALHRPKYNTVHKPREASSIPLTVMVAGVALTLNAHVKPQGIERRL